MLYRDVRPAMQTGDVIAFAQSSFVSWVIRRFTRFNVSHVGIVLRTEHVVELLEAGGDGIHITQLSARLEEYAHNNGRMWWCPAKRPSSFDAEAMVRDMLGQVGTSYDIWQAILTCLWPWPTESSRRLFCSESVGFALRAGHILPDRINPSHATPGDVCSWNIFDGGPYQLLGEPEPIKAYNTVPTSLWRAA